MRVSIRVASLAISTILAGTAPWSPLQANPVSDYGKAGRNIADDPTDAHLGGRSTPRVTIRSLAGRQVEVGTAVRFEIKANRDGYAHLYVISASGRVQLWMENVPIRAGVPLRYPDKRFAIKATGPLGKDRIAVLVTRDRLHGFHRGETTRLPHDLGLDERAIGHALEAIMADYRRSDWTWAKATVDVIE